MFSVTEALDDLGHRLSRAADGRPRTGPSGRLSEPRAASASSLRGHQGEVQCGVRGAASTAGTCSASGGDDGTVRLWDPEHRSSRSPVLEGHQGRVNAVCAVHRRGPRPPCQRQPRRDGAAVGPAAAASRSPRWRGHRGAASYAVCAVTVERPGAAAPAAADDQHGAAVGPAAPATRSPRWRGHRARGQCGVRGERSTAGSCWPAAATTSTVQAVGPAAPATGRRAGHGRPATEVSAVCAVTVERPGAARQRRSTTVRCRLWDPRHRRTTRHD